MTSYKHKMRLAALAAALGASVLAGCSAYNSVTARIVQHVTPYRVTIVQGNFVSSDAAAKLRVGMTRDEVRAALGTPLLTDMFHPERWDYIFYFKRGSTAVVEQRDVVVNFDGDKVVGWSGTSDLPSNQDLIEMIDSSRSERNWLRERQSQRASEAKAQAAAGASTPAAVVPASAGAVPANQRAADAANNALAASTPAVTVRAPNVPQSNVVRAGPASPVQATPEPQFHLTTPNHLRPAGGSSLLARPPGADDATPASGTSAN
ncbi:outer membrane protein assembly factor BamE [Robbsia andropogonis]|nr:outer membrane protein assembly factor BamE [Robbsia andropogonis]